MTACVPLGIDHGRWFSHCLWSMVYGPFEQRILLFPPLLQIGLPHASSQSAHSPEVALPFGHSDRAARVPDIEGLVALEHIVISGHDQSLLKGGFGFGFEAFEDLFHALDIADLIVILAVLE